MPKKIVRSLAGKTATDALFKGGRRFRSELFTLIVLFEPTDSRPRALYSIRKKLAKSAVLRNRIRRVLRECIQEVFCAEQPNLSSGFGTFAIVLNSLPDKRLISVEQFLPIVQELIAKAKSYTVAKRV